MKQNTMIVLTCFGFGVILAILVVNEVMTYRQNTPPATDTVATKREIDSLSRASASLLVAQDSIVLSRFPEFDSLRVAHDTAGMCMRLMRSWGEIDQIVFYNEIRLFEPVDSTTTFNYKTYVTAARFLRDHCGEVAGKLRLNRETWDIWENYQMARRIAYVAGK